MIYRRHNGAMSVDSQNPRVVDLSRINLRLPEAVFRSIDHSRSKRFGTVSRNTWITEAIQEKLLRDCESSQSSNEALQSA